MQLPEPLATRRTGIVRLSPFVATPNISNTSSPNVMLFSNAVSLTLIWKTWMRYSSVKASRWKPMLLLSLPPSSSPQATVRFSSLRRPYYHSLTFLLSRWRIPSQGLSLCSSRTTHDPSWISSYATLLCWPRWSSLPPSSAHATSPRLQSSLAPHVPAPPTAHPLSASSSGSARPPSIVFCCPCT